MFYKFCSKCGNKLVKKINHEKASRQYCNRCDLFFYQNSRPCVTAIIVKQDKILLTKRGIDPYKGFWDLPGGFLEEGEHPKTGIKREVKEELGVEIKLDKIIGFFIDKYLSAGKDLYTLNVCYLSKITKGNIIPASDVKSVKWVNLDSLPKKFAFKNVIQAIESYKRLTKV
ncbi:NUDIX hydrolase [Patescibacteria group bacterium]|nr:NUDIX hydrolase [Patescibacteria group bacterium]